MARQKTSDRSGLIATSWKLMATGSIASTELFVAASFPTCRVFKADSISSKLVAAGVEGFGQLPVAVRFQNTLQDHSVIGVGTQISRSAGRKSRAEQDRLDGKFFREINAGSDAAT
jgi:hypothetical protein